MASLAAADGAGGDGGGGGGGAAAAAAAAAAGTAEGGAGDDDDPLHAWLAGLELPDPDGTHAALRAEDVATVADARRLDDGDLRELGFTIGVRNRLAAGIQALAAESASAASAADVGGGAAPASSACALDSASTDPATAAADAAAWRAIEAAHHEGLVTTLRVPSGACPSLDVLFRLLMSDGPRWSRAGVKRVVLAPGEHVVTVMARDKRGRAFRGLCLRGRHYAGLTFAGDGMDKTTVRSATICLEGRETRGHIRFEDLAVVNPLGYGLLCYGGVRDVHATRCLFADCGAGGVSVCDAGTVLEMRDCVVRANQISGVCAALGGVVELRGERTAVHGNAGIGLHATHTGSVIRLHVPRTVVFADGGNVRADASEFDGGMVQDKAVRVMGVTLELDDIPIPGSRGMYT